MLFLSHLFVVFAEDELQYLVHGLRSKVSLLAGTEGQGVFLYFLVAYDKEVWYFFQLRLAYLVANALLAGVNRRPYAAGFELLKNILTVLRISVRNGENPYLFG